MLYLLRKMQSRWIALRAYKIVNWRDQIRTTPKQRQLPKPYQSSILASLAFYLQTSTLKILPTPLMHSRESCSQKLKERKQNDRQSFEIGVQAM